MNELIGERESLWDEVIQRWPLEQKKPFPGQTSHGRARRNRTTEVEE